MVVKLMMNNSSIVDSPDYYQPSTCPVHGWKLYDNPVFALTSCNRDGSTGIHKQSHCKCGNNNHHNHPHRKCESKMKPHKVVQELKMEVELERKVRKKVEALNKKLQDDIDRMRLEFEEERKMLKMAEVLREERLQMKLSDANLLFHHKCREMQQTFSNGQEESCKTAVQENVSLHSCEEETSKVRKCHSSCSSRSTVTSIGDQSNRSTSRNHNYNVSPNVSPYGKGVKKKASPEPENPHIRRGIKGFVEFPRGKLVKALNGSSNYSGVKHRDMATKLECQKSQLRLMLKQKVTPLLSVNPLVTT